MDFMNPTFVAQVGSVAGVRSGSSTLASVRTNVDRAVSECAPGATALGLLVIEPDLDLGEDT